VDDTTTLYTRSCNVVDMIVDRWRASQKEYNDGELTALAYGALTRQVANDLRKTEMYQANMAFVRQLADDSGEVGLSLDGIPGDLSDLFDVFDDDEPSEGQ
jgi:hypothetical protein